MPFVEGANYSGPSLSFIYQSNTVLAMKVGFGWLESFSVVYDKK